jgi:hypothetical protein
MMRVSFPGGAGGNWLKDTLLQGEYATDSVNFHNTTSKKSSKIKLVHELDIRKFDYLYSGKSYFNFYLNVMYKLFHHERDIFNKTDYKTYFLESINTARFLCKFDQIYDHTFFNFDELINFPDNFYKKLVEYQTNNNLSVISLQDFLSRRDMFFSTCVNTSSIKFNFDNMFWVCFVIGQLMNLEIYPRDFSIYEYQNQDKCKQFAVDNYHFCTHIKIYDIDTKVFMPKLL